MPISRPSSPLWRWLYENSLLLSALLLTAGTLAAQAVVGWHEYNDELEKLKLATLGFGQYLRSGHFLEATFENWESEFLQMGLFVLLTVWLRQRGSSESKKLYEAEDVDQEPDLGKADAPGPVRRGGWRLAIYRNSLSLTFFALFLASVLLHAKGGAEEMSIENQAHGEPPIGLIEYLGTSRFWFESLQNWQSEMLSICAIVGLSIFLRQQGSPQSKPVDAPDSQTGKE